MSKPKILIVDDDKSLLSLTRTLLEKLGSFETCTEHRSFAALATARTFCPDLVLLDVDMPGKDGGDVAAELGADAVLSRVPIIFLTSLVSKDEAGVRNGVRYLSKPVNPQLLLQAVREALAVAA
ncbi:MAG: response regulator [Chthoniobacteraceae bacterium]